MTPYRRTKIDPRIEEFGQPIRHVQEFSSELLRYKLVTVQPLQSTNNYCKNKTKTTSLSSDIDLHILAKQRKQERDRPGNEAQ